jgi:hypothetical protein
LLAFLRGITANNLLLVDKDKEMVSRLCEVIRTSLDHVPPAYEKRLAVMVEALRNLPTIVALPLVTIDSQDCSGVASAVLAHSAAGEGCADAVVVIPPIEVQRVRPTLPPSSVEVVDLCVYGASRLEHRRSSFCEQIAASDRDEAEVTDLFRRALRFSRSLALYDRNLGQYFEVKPDTQSHAIRILNGRERFAASLEFFLKQWRVTRGAGPRELTAKVLTAYDEKRISGYARADQDRFRSEVIAFAKDVAARTDVQVDIEIKDAPWRVAHDRYIETEQAVLALPGGIDIIHSESPGSASMPRYRSNRNVQLVLGDAVRVDLGRYSETRTFLRCTSC